MLTLIFPMLLWLGIPAEVGQGPRPADIPTAWEFEFTFLDPQRIEVRLPGQSAPEVYWYMAYTVTNPSRTAQRFFPTLQIVTEDLKVVDTDMGIPAEVFDAIAARHKVTHKYMVHPTKAIGALLSGDDNARESVAIWRGLDLSENEFRIYVAGLSGETRFLPNPTARSDKPGKAPRANGEKPAAKDGPAAGQDKDGKPRNFTLRKTLEIRYNLPGSARARTSAEPERGEMNWIMR